MKRIKAEMTAAVLAAGMILQPAVLTYAAQTGEAGKEHTYIIETGDVTWSEAKDKAMEAGGYLVRFETQEEYERVLGIIQEKGLGNYFFLIGGTRNQDSYDYHWVRSDGSLDESVTINDPSFWATATNQWMHGEPSFTDGTYQEPCLDFYYYSDEGRWVWNDVPDDILSVAPYYSGRIAYIIEIGEDEEPAAEEPVSGGTDVQPSVSAENSQGTGVQPSGSAENSQGTDAQPSGAKRFNPNAIAGSDSVNGTASPSGTASASAQTDAASVLKDIPDEFFFSSGAGAWASTIWLNDDGTFTGTYDDADMGGENEQYPEGVLYSSRFSGRFSDFTKVDDYTFSMKLADLRYTTPTGTDATDGRKHYYYTEAHGIAGGDTFYLYLPGHPVDTLPEGYQSLLFLYDPDHQNAGQNISIYGIYNEATESAWRNSEQQ